MGFYLITTAKLSVQPKSSICLPSFFGAKTPFIDFCQKLDFDCANVCIVGFLSLSADIKSPHSQLLFGYGDNTNRLYDKQFI